MEWPDLLGARIRLSRVNVSVYFVRCGDSWEGALCLMWEGGCVVVCVYTD